MRQQTLNLSDKHDPHAWRTLVYKAIAQAQIN